MTIKINFCFQLKFLIFFFVFHENNTLGRCTKTQSKKWGDVMNQVDSSNLPRHDFWSADTTNPLMHSHLYWLFPIRMQWPFSHAFSMSSQMLGISYSWQRTAKSAEKQSWIDFDSKSILDSGSSSPSFRSGQGSHVTPQALLAPGTEQQQSARLVVRERAFWALHWPFRTLR